MVLWSKSTVSNVNRAMVIEEDSLDELDCASRPGKVKEPETRGAHLRPEASQSVLSKAFESSVTNSITVSE